MKPSADFRQKANDKHVSIIIIHKFTSYGIHNVLDCFSFRFFFSVLIALMIYHYLDATPVSTTESLSTDKPIRVPSYYYGQTVTINVYRWLVSTYGQNAVDTAGVISLDNRYGK